MTRITEAKINYLNFLLKSYVGVTKLIAATINRLHSLPGDERDPEFDTLLKGMNKTDGFNTVKGRIEREIEKELELWDIWTLWLKNIRGCGPYIAAQFIILFYYRFVAICKDCGEKLEKQEIETKDGKTFNALVCVGCGKIAKDGLLKYNIEHRDFSTISKWWKFMGRHTVNGVVPKNKKGVVSDWSTVGKTIGYQFAEQVNRQQDDHLYKAFLLERKAKHERNHHDDDWPKGRIHNAAKNETIKLFEAHFWVVARTLQGKEISEPYAGAIMGHTNIIKPFYWES